MCNILNIKFILLLKLKDLIKFDDRYVLSIIYVIRFKLTITLHFEFTISLLIIDNLKKIVNKQI